MVASVLVSIGLVLVIEGILPLLSPSRWRASVARIAELRDGQLRFIGLMAVLLGLLLIIV